MAGLSGQVSLTVGLHLEESWALAKAARALVVMKKVERIVIDCGRMLRRGPIELLLNVNRVRASADWLMRVM